ncbi:hypothetical protein GCM10027589_16150 [Actinocorallia lasiicapitis]
MIGRGIPFTLPHCSRVACRNSAVPVPRSGRRSHARGARKGRPSPGWKVYLPEYKVYPPGTIPTGISRSEYR